jgi:enoyl-CoA hydratase
MIDSKEALRIGLVNRVFPLSELLNKTKELCSKIVSKSPKIISMAIQAVNYNDVSEIRHGLNMEAVLFGICCGTEDFKEGTSAFLEKRKPEFRNK